MSAIEVLNITKKFGDFTAVDAVSFAVAEGEIFGLLGPNGAGKSTLIRVLTTLMKPTSGTGVVGGFDVVEQASSVRRAIGVIPQALTSDLDLTAEENLVIYALAGAIKAVLAGVVLMLVGSLIAGVPNPLDPMRLFRLLVVISVSSVTLVSMMFLFMVRMEDPLLPRALFGVLNTLLFFPSGAVYPQQAFPSWMRAIAVADPFTYAVHALKALLLKNAGFPSIGLDLVYLLAFSFVSMTAATLLFRREL